MKKPKETKAHMLSIARRISIGSHAVALDVVDLLERLVHSGNSEGFDLHDLDVTVSSVLCIEFSDAVSSCMTKDFVAEFDGLGINGTEVTVAVLASHAVLNQVMDFVTESIVIFFGPLDLLARAADLTFLADDQLVSSGPVPTKGVFGIVSDQD